MFAKFCKEMGAELYYSLKIKMAVSGKVSDVHLWTQKWPLPVFKWWKAQKCTYVSQMWFPHITGILGWCIWQDEHSLTPHCKVVIIILYYTFFMQLYYIHKESKPTCCTILFFICSLISKMLQSDLLAIFRESYAVMFQLKFSHVVTTVVVCTIINY